MYELSRNRFKELKHFCLRYHEMKREIESLEGQLYLDEFDPTARIAIKLNEYRHAVKLIETTAFNIGVPGNEVLLAVTEDRCRGDTCELYLRKFYWMLDKVKGM